MEKIVDGVELLRMIRDGELVNGDRIKFGGEIFILNIEEREFYVKGKPAQKQYSLFQCWTVDNIFDFKFEILPEDDEEIDIDSMKEMYISNIKLVGESETKCWTGRSLDIAFANKINEIIKAMKQINKQINKQMKEK